MFSDVLSQLFDSISNIINTLGNVQHPLSLVDSGCFYLTDSE
ncbi:hypothetical protein OE903_18820 [Bacillus sp. B6(2022)]|nr:hypothetical protein [Bacillus sp. B6(2022)]